MHRARRLVASQLLSDGPDPSDNAPSVSRWRAWLFAAWVAVVVAVYLATMAGLIH